MKRATRLRNMPVYPFARWGREIARMPATGRDVIRLDMGNPDLPPPEPVVEALCQAARRPDRHGYAGYGGIAALREAIAAYYARRFDVALDPGSQVLPLIGSKEGIVNLALACLDPGDVVLVPDPGYAPYTMGASLAGAQVYTFPLSPERGFLPDLGAIPAPVAERAVLMWLNYPNNPTGGTADLDFMAEAVAWAQRHDLLLCHDAPYVDVTYDQYTAPSLLQVPGAAEVAVEFNSLSKTWNMAGWRVGMAVGNAEALAALAHVKSNVDTGIFNPIQEAAAQALSLDPQWIAERNEIYRERLELLVEGVQSWRVPVQAPKATLYLWTRVPGGETSEAFALRMARETSVVVAPGSFFGPAGEGFLRLSATAATAQVREAVRRMKTFGV
jgi:LL-diaminopimelate aminotransferase